MYIRIALGNIYVTIDLEITIGLTGAKMNTVELKVRQNSMRQLREEGKTLQEIADLYKITKERVRQIISNPDITIREPHPYIKKTDRIYSPRRINPNWKVYKKEYLKEKHRENRRLAIESLGGICKKCGFSDPRALQIDHINGGGIQELKSRTAYSIYKWIRENINDAKKKYQVLCANCNWIKRWENDEVMKGRNLKNK